MVILENIDIDIDKAILQNINIDKISNRFKFGISNRASHSVTDKDKDKDKDRDRDGDRDVEINLVTQLNVPDKLRNLNPDINALQYCD